MKIVVCGGRKFDSRALVYQTLGAIPGVSFVIEGGAPGADRLAREWAEEMGIHYATVKALWDTYGLSAGPRRNRAMLELKPDLVVAFPGNKGTADMVTRAREAYINVLVVEDPRNWALMTEKSGS